MEVTQTYRGEDVEAYITKLEKKRKHQEVTLQFLDEQIERKNAIQNESTELRRELANIERNKNNLKNAKREFSQLEKQLIVKNDAAERSKKNLEVYKTQAKKQREEKERKIQKKITRIKETRCALEKDYKHLEQTSNVKETGLKQEINVLDLTVEKLTKTNSNLEENQITASLKTDAEIEKLLLEEDKRYDELKKQLEQERGCILKDPTIICIQLPDSKSDLHTKNKKLHVNFVSKTILLADQSRLLQNKDKEIYALEKQCEELQHEDSKLQTSEETQLIPVEQWENRQLRAKVKALTASNTALQNKYEEDQRVIKEMSIELPIIRKRYIREKMHNQELGEALMMIEGTHQPGEESAAAAQVPHFGMQRVKQCHAKTLGLVGLPLSSRKPKFDSKVIPRPVNKKYDKLVQPQVTRMRIPSANRKLGGKPPPLLDKCQQEQHKSLKFKLFLTETECYREQN
ncbi:cingulin-like [Notolabrus celidotus]|uniref:cingulin-like n=1 Tax=Notolabrus celidotus TaxID=1203425 RepID=UPI00148F9B11|nr:cingulin-like [Notolabrus celidotus]